MKPNTIYSIFAVLVICLAFSSVTNAGNIIVIVNNSSGITSATADEVSKVYMGKSNSVGGTDVEPVDQVSSSQVRSDFSEKILGRTVKKVTDFWKKRIFAGKGEPPKELSDDTRVISFVRSNPGAIGYISAGSLTDAVKAVEVDGKKEW